jgi:hypothetical protein
VVNNEVGHSEIQIVDEFIPWKFFPFVKQLIEGAEFGTGVIMGKDFSGYGHITLPVRARIEDEIGAPIDIVMSHVRLGKRSTPLTHFIHADAIAADYACVWCLSEPKCDSGTAFWVHKETGHDRLTLPCEDELFQKYDKDVQEEKMWNMVAYVPSKMNRAVLFNSSLFHSRYPKELLVSDDEIPRIVCTVFFNIQEEV